MARSTLMKEIMARILATEALIAAIVAESKEKALKRKEEDKAAARKRITLNTIARRAPVVVDLGARQNASAPHNQPALHSKTNRRAA